MAVRKKWDLGFDASRVLRSAYVMLFFGGQIVIDERDPCERFKTKTNPPLLMTSLPRQLPFHT